MCYRCANKAIRFVALMLLAMPAAAATLATCDANFTTCIIPENISLQLPFGAIAGDVILTEPLSSTASDVFRIFNNLVNTGEGTGIGNMVFLYSADDSALPDPSTYSANAVFVPEDPSGITSYLGNGTNYILNAPEPGASKLIGLACIAMAILARRRSQRSSKEIASCDRHS